MHKFILKRVKDILRITLLVGILLLGIGGILEESALACGWFITVEVDSGGMYSSIAISSDEMVHISYRGNNGRLKYASYPW